MRSVRFAVALTAFAVLSPLSLADDTAGLQILIDMQDPALVSKTFCVRDSKLYSLDAEICISGTVKQVCSLVDAADPTKGVKWASVDEKQKCRQ